MMSDTIIDKGIITHIYLENFVTYDKVVVNPGRNLNVIIGPNGTGKSTIVCAIVLGLGGKPSTIGRALHVAEYVKAGCQEAKIEIHLTNGTRNNVVITRQFDVLGKSLWFLNKQSSNLKAVQELTKSFDIQIDNLCQFLPQDKVQDFSKMNAQQLLENTERSVGDPIILEHHKNLINYREQHKELEIRIASKKKVLESKMQVYEGLKETVSSVKERKLIKKRIISLKQKKAWILYAQIRKDLLKLKKTKDKAAANVASLEAELNPVNDIIAKLNSEIKLLQNSIVDYNNKVHVKNSRLRKMLDEIAECENRIKEWESTCKQRIEAEQNRDHDIAVAEQQKNKLDNDLEVITNEIGSEETLVKLRQQALSNVERQRDIINTLSNQGSVLKQEAERTNYEIRAQETELQSLNIQEKRLQLLRERSTDTYKAVLWLRENRDKFSGTIHEPMILSINVKDVKYAKYLENIIPFRDLIAFVCEDKRDMNALLRYLRDQQNLQVNAVHSDPATNVPMQPNIALESIKRFGFTYYLDSLIDAPRTIIKYLITMYRLNNIPLGTNVVEENIDHIPQSINCYFSQNNVYSVSISKYTGEKSTRMQSVSGSGMLSIVLDHGKLKRIEERLTALKEKKHDIYDKLKEIDKKMSEHNKEVEKHRAERHKYQQDIQQIQGVKSRISIASQKIRELQSERTSIEQIKQSCTNEIKVIFRKQIKIYKMYNTELEESFKCVTANEEHKLALKLKAKLLRTKTSDTQELREKLRTAEERVRQLAIEIQPMKDTVQKTYNEALETTEGISPSDPGFAPINKIFNKLPPTVDEINKELNIAQAKAFCMGNNVNGENILQEYESVEAEIEDLKQFIQEKTKKAERITQRMQELKEQWLGPLNEIIDKINSNFSSYFSAMDCAGEVMLAPAENIMDFHQYGLKIRVKFRDTDQLQELTRYHQSGGERAVTTAIYMISLQELSRVPFRCVDEINQGMDAINERRVFNLLVKMTGRPNSSQYFLLTPKLLPGLQYSETVRVHCVFNGPFVIGHADFDTEKYCKHVIKALEKSNVNDD